jgi:hypothetical protein
MPQLCGCGCAAKQNPFQGFRRPIIGNSLRDALGKLVTAVLRSRQLAFKLLVRRRIHRVRFLHSCISHVKKL